MAALCLSCVLAAGYAAGASGQEPRGTTLVERFLATTTDSAPVSYRAKRSVADVRIVGRSTFSMAYEYKSINGQDLVPAASEAP